MVAQVTVLLDQVLSTILMLLFRNAISGAHLIFLSQPFAKTRMSSRMNSSLSTPSCNSLSSRDTTERSCFKITRLHYCIVQLQLAWWEWLRNLLIWEQVSVSSITLVAHVVHEIVVFLCESGEYQRP